MEEGKKMFSIFAARMFEQRVLQAYREKVAQERQLQLLRELEDEDKVSKEREAKKQNQNQKKKDKKRYDIKLYFPVNTQLTSITAYKSLPRRKSVRPKLPRRRLRRRLWRLSKLLRKKRVGNVEKRSEPRESYSGRCRRRRSYAKRKSVVSGSQRRKSEKQSVSASGRRKRKRRSRSARREKSVSARLAKSARPRQLPRKQLVEKENSTKRRSGIGSQPRSERRRRRQRRSGSRKRRQIKSERRKRRQRRRNCSLSNVPQRKQRVLLLPLTILSPLDLLLGLLPHQAPPRRTASRRPLPRPLLLLWSLPCDKSLSRDRLL
jgi:hypothetical protein